jgi:hypothetical protein
LGLFRRRTQPFVVDYPIEILADDRKFRPDKPVADRDGPIAPREDILRLISNSEELKEEYSKRAMRRNLADGANEQGSRIPASRTRPLIYLWIAATIDRPTRNQKTIPTSMATKSRGRNQEAEQPPARCSEECFKGELDRTLHDPSNKADQGIHHWLPNMAGSILTISGGEPANSAKTKTAGALDPAATNSTTQLPDWTRTRP